MRKLLFTLAIVLSLAMSGAAIAASPQQLASLKQQFQLPESQIDLAVAKLAIDKMIDPKRDITATL